MQTAIINKSDASLKRAAKKSATLARQKAIREKLHQRADGWVAPENRHETATRLVDFVIRRIEFPKYGEPFKLSATDKDDARAAGISACVQSGFFEHGLATAKVIKDIRNAINGRACLRLRATWEYGTDDAATVAAKVGFSTEYEEIGHRLTPAQRDMAKEIMRTLRATLAADPGRKAQAAFRGNRDFFLLVLGHLTGRTGRVMQSCTFDTRKSRFLDYLAKGAKLLRANRKPPNLAGEILASLAARALT